MRSCGCLQARCRRQIAGRGLRPGRPHQHLRDRCRRLDHHAADRRGAARGRTPAGLAAEITAKLRNGYIRDPSVAVEIESYRPFFILGEVAAPGQYPYVPNMSVESAVAIAGGFSPRARRDRVTLTHTDGSGSMRAVVPLGTAARPRRYRARRRTLVLTMPLTPDQPLRILHAVRAPVGGIFRHILDLANGQADRGHHVGIIADSLTGGERAEAALAEIAPAPQARRSPHRHSPRTASRRHSGMGAFHAPDPAAEAGRAARPRRQGRRLHPPADPAPTTTFASTRRMAARCITRWIRSRARSTAASNAR